MGLNQYLLDLTIAGYDIGNINEWGILASKVLKSIKLWADPLHITDFCLSVVVSIFNFSKFVLLAIPSF